MTAQAISGESAYEIPPTTSEETDISALQEAFANGTYPEWLEQEAKREEHASHICSDIAYELECMKSLTPEQRLEDYNWIVRYYSRSKTSFEGTSLNLHEATNCTEDDIREGNYSSIDVALRLMRKLREYDATTIVPIITQVREYITTHFANHNILFLGRDFCSTYLYIVNEGILDRSNLFLCNVSRYVRDVAKGGQTTELRMVLERIGLTKEALLRKGLLIADSCMQGKIPAIILKSLALGMNPVEQYQFLTNCHVRYLKSSRTKGISVADQAKILGAKHREHDPDDETKYLDAIDIEELLSDKLDKIEEFPIDYPAHVAEYIPRRHKLFEWRPKVSKISMGIEVDELGPRLIAHPPVTPSEKVLSLLGLYGEIQFAQTASRTLRQYRKIERIGHHVVSNAEYKKPAALKPNWYLAEIDRALENGLKGLREWQDAANPNNVGSVAVMRTNNIHLPYELIINGKIIYQFKDIVGEGNNVKVYVTEHNTIVKVIKDAKHVRKNLLLAWAEPFVRSVGIHTARVLTVSPTGLYLEQELVPGKSLEDIYGEEQNVPQSICALALKDFRAAKQLIADKGIWLDLKSANYHLSTDPMTSQRDRIINVDYTPRLNSTYYRFFQDDVAYSGNLGPNESGLTEGLEKERRDLTDEEFLDRFFHHDTRKRKALAAQALAAASKIPPEAG